MRGVFLFIVLYWKFVIVKLKAWCELIRKCLWKHTYHSENSYFVLHTLTHLHVSTYILTNAEWNKNNPFYSFLNADTIYFKLNIYMEVYEYETDNQITIIATKSSYCCCFFFHVLVCVCVLNRNWNSKQFFRFFQILCFFSSFELNLNRQIFS